MNAGTIWWGQLGSSLRLLTKVINNLRDCQSAVLQVPIPFPWRKDFYDAIEIRRAAFSAARRLVRLEWKGGADPGEFVLEQLCSSQVRADYWPGQTYAAYLGSQDGLLMNDYYVWVMGIHSKADMVAWAEFIMEYQSVGQELESCAVFLLEYDGANVVGSGLDMIRYAVENCDCRVFAIEAATELGNTALHDYQSELAVRICANDPELCSVLLLAGERLLQDPVRAAVELTASACSSEGLPFVPMDEQQAQSAAWEAAVVSLFPVLEHCRMRFIDANEAKLARHLPISNSNGDQVTDPWDLELGALFHIVSASSKEFSNSDADSIRLCRRARNLLAHNKIVPLDDVQKLLGV